MHINQYGNFWLFLPISFVALLFPFLHKTNKASKNVTIFTINKVDFRVYQLYVIGIYLPIH